MNVLVFDLGTTNFKASVFDANGALLALTGLPTPILSSHDERCEIDIHVFHDQVSELMNRLDKIAEGITKRVGVITFATQTNSFVLLDEDGEPLSHIILWPDDRARNHGGNIARLAELPDFCATTGVSMLSHQFMAAKLAWLHFREPDMFKRIARICLISDYLTLWFTHRHVTEAGAAGLTGLLNIHTLEWWPEACELANIKTEWLPHVVRAGTDLGPIGPEIAEDLGLPGSCRFAAGCLDQYAGAIGVGNVVQGGISETTGTVLATVRYTEQFNKHPPAGVFQGPASMPGTYYRMAFCSTSANWLEDYRGTLDDAPSFAQLDEEAAEVAPGADGLSLPIDCEDGGRKELLGQYTNKHSRGHAVRVILETVAQALAEQVRLLCGDCPPAQITCAGGGARSPLWLQIKANTLNTPMRTVRCPEPASLGAAILALHALTGDTVLELAQTLVATAETMAPNVETHPA